VGLTAAQDARSPSIAEMQARVGEASDFLKKLCNPQRLMLVCSLVEGERSVRELEDLLGIRQPALSQQLAELREAGLIAGRKEGRIVHYRLADPRVTRFVTTMHELFCEDR
jgi:DNA-binding transcriptional ArsR family regulator